MCRDSNNSDWIYVIKSGSCKVLKTLHSTQPDIRGLEKQTYSAVSPREKRRAIFSLLINQSKVRRFEGISGNHSNIFTCSVDGFK